MRYYDELESNLCLAGTIGTAVAVWGLWGWWAVLLVSSLALFLEGWLNLFLRRR